MAMDARVEVTLWADEMSVDIVERVLSHLKKRIKPIGLGGQRSLGLEGQSSSQLEALGDHLQLSVVDDLRQLLVQQPARYVLLATQQGVTDAHLHEAAQAGTTLLTLEPWASDRGNMTPASGPRHVLPAFKQTPGWVAAADPVNQLGTLRQIRFISQMGFSSLFTQLYLAWQMVLHLIDLPQSLHASLVGHAPNHLPQQLHAMTGHLSLHAKFTTSTAYQDLGSDTPGQYSVPSAASQHDAQGSLVMQLTDRGPTSCRELTLVGDLGQLQVTDLGYCLIDQHGQVRDQQVSPTRLPDQAQLIADHWQHLLNHDHPQAAMPAHMAIEQEQHITACCLASLLSCKTGQPESPTKLWALKT